MEQTTPSTSSSNSKFWMWLVIIAIPVGILAYLIMNNQTKSPSEQVATNNQALQASDVQVETTPIEISTSPYKDGTYSAVGNYISPGGAEQVGLTLTLKDGVITDSTFEPKAFRPMSVNFQGKFASGYKEFVIGKKIDEVNVTKVSGSSLTPKGFNDALAKIKTEAQS